MIWDELRFFKKTEFNCRCGCGRNNMEPEFLKKLDTARGILGFPLIISSGYRCPSHNERVSTTGKSGPHTTGRAADVLIFGREAYILVRYMSLHGGMTGLGINQRGAHDKRFIHLDDLEQSDGRYRPTVWTY